MTGTLAKTLMALGLLSGAALAFADPPPTVGWDICIDPMNMMPRSPDFAVNSRANDLFRVSVGGSGTITYGGQNGPCFIPGVTANAAGRIGFGSGPVGSIQDDIAGEQWDNNMVYTFGMPNSPAGNWSYAVVRRHDPAGAAGNVTSTLFGTAISGNFFAGASGRYIYIEQTSDNVYTQVRTDVLGDACRVRWSLTNLAATPQQLGLWYGAQMAILLGDTSASTGLFGVPVYWVIPGHKPLTVDQRFTRATDPANFPSYIQACFGQSHGYGLQVEMGPTPATQDAQGNSDATQVDELVIGSAPFVVGSPASGADTNAPPDFVFGDVFLGSDQFLMKYQPEAAGGVPTNQARVIFSYFRDTWGNSRYIRTDSLGHPLGAQPYSSVVDAPHLLPNDEGGTGTNGLANNPFTIRVYVDNTGGYSFQYTGVPINDVQVHLNLPPGMSLANGDTADKTIFSVQPLEVAFVDYQVEADGIEVGDLPYSVTISSTPGPPANNPIIHSGTIRVSATKQIKLEPNANLISAPWVFTDSSWEAALGLLSPQDFTAYTWDPQQIGYVLSGAAERGKGYWIILNPDRNPPGEIVQPYAGASTPGDMQSGAPNIQLHAGWNLIGDPYPYAIPLSQIVGVSAANPGNSYSFASLVAQNIVTPYLAYWDTTVQNYRYIQGQDAIMQPNKGYFIKVNTSQDLTLNYPPVYDTFLPGGRVQHAQGWVQTPNHWRLNIQGRSGTKADEENYIGVATAAGQARANMIQEPPQGPTQGVTVSIDGGSQGALAQALEDHNGQLQWPMSITNKQGGFTTLSWPNISSVPSNVSFRIVDNVTHQSLDMRSRSSISMTMGPNSTRRFTIQVRTGAALPVIGGIWTTTGRLASHTPVTVRYQLNYDANVTVRILNAQGNPVVVLYSNRELNAGQNTAAWDLKNANGGYVSAGSYRVEVQATVDGNTVHKVGNVIVAR